jgi:pteridine reductase
MTESIKKVAFVTGAAKRIGREIACQFHRGGYNVIIHYRNSENEAKELADELNQVRNNSVSIVCANLDDTDDIQHMCKKVTEAFGRIDVLVNNASTFYPTEISSATPTDWNALFNSNLKAPYFIIKNLANELSNHSGSIINIVDIHADKPLAGYSIYCMAKAGLVSLTKSLSDELAPKIRVNGIAPGPILWHDNPISDTEKRNVLSEVSLQRMGEPSDIAQAALYLANASYVTGQILAVDGGRSVKAIKNA